MEFFTELAVHETERWIQAVTRKKFQYPDDPRKSLQNGLLLCELLNTLRPGSVKRINKLDTPIAYLDNLNVFLNSCRSHFWLTETQLFDPSDLEDLSQRAISESDQLKEELDRRLRNVAITVYWIGKKVSHSSQVPQLDFSAFSPLVHHHSKDIISDDHFRRDLSCSWESNEHSSAYGSHDGNSHGSIRDSLENRHQQDSSYESYASYEKGSEDSLDEQVFDNMPVPRYGSSSALNRSGDGRLYSEDRNLGMYRSSPDISQGSHIHCRSSSNDSLDGSYYSGHSRQSSGSVEAYPTRNPMQRRTSSSSADPMQFVKVKGQQELAKQAEEQMKVVAETKKMKVITSDKDDDDWLSNLSSWKTRRRSQSEKAFLLKEELEAKAREEEEEKHKSSMQQKTFSQMKEEREQRKSASTRNFYPLSEEEDLISPIRSTRQEGSYTGNHVASSTPSKKEDDVKTSTIKDDDIPDWARNSNSEEEESDQSETEDKNNNQPADRKNGKADDVFREPSTNADKQSRNTAVPNRFKQLTERDVFESEQNARNNMESPGSSKINNIRNRFEQSEEKPRTRSSVVDHKIDVKARTKSFENFEKTDVVESLRPTKSSTLERRYGQRVVQDTENEPISVRNTLSQERKYSPGYQERTTNRTSAVDTSGSPGHSYEYSSLQATYASSKMSGKDYVEKTIKISQKPNNDKGFGFNISGGSDMKAAVVVEKVSLGSSADVNELQAKDEILTVNKIDISRLTNQEVLKLIQDSVPSGQLELRVKRFLGSKDDDDDFLSSDEEFERLDSRSRQLKSDSMQKDANNSYDSKDSRASQEDFRHAANTNPVASALDEERQYLSEQLEMQSPPPPSRFDNVQSSYRYDSYEHPEPVKLTRGRHETGTEQTSYNSSHSYPQSDSSSKHEDLFSDHCTDNRHDIEVESRQMITIKRTTVEGGIQRDEEDDTRPRASSGIRHETKTTVESSSAGNTSAHEDTTDSVGPPAILRKWQRQRPKSEYTFEPERPPVQARLSSTLPWMSDNKTVFDDKESKDDMAYERARHDFEATVKDQPVPSPRRMRINQSEDRKRMKEWDKKQEKMRQPDDENAIEIQFSYNKDKFMEDQEWIRQQYEDDQKRAAELAKQKEEQERQMLEPEMERIKSLEERRQERRQRLQQLNMQPQSEYAQTNRHQQPPSQEESRTLHMTNRHQGGEVVENRSTMSFQVHAPNEPTKLVIDPQNRAVDSSNGQSYNFRVNINQLETPEGLYIRPEIRASPIQRQQANHEALLEQERERIRKEELMKIEEERRRMEEEEQRRFREKEAQLREQEERLHQEAERLRLEQERFQQEQKEHEQLLRRSADFSDPKTTVAQFGPVSSRVREPSPTYSSTVHHRRPEMMRSNAGPQYSTTVVVEPKPQFSVKKVDPVWQRSNHGNQPSESKSLDRKDISRLREDMLAMNRKATPLQDRPEMSPPTSPNSTGPIKREVPSRQQLHSLNAVPKPKFRNSNDWIGPQEVCIQQESRVPSRHSQIMKKQYSTPQEHWLFEEAERRRLAHDAKMLGRQPAHLQFSGPIKPIVDNRWRDERHADRHQSDINTSFERHGGNTSMPAQIRQTLLQKTAGARSSTGSNYSQDLGTYYPQYPIQPTPTSLSQTMPASYNYNSGHAPREPRHDSMPVSVMRESPPPEGHAVQNMPVSGKQRCSHCSQELGFGAAMIIESLGLIYHVQCFKCCVCHTPLGTGNEGADVRVRVNKLHCPNCYSNDEAGLKFSKV